MTEPSFRELVERQRAAAEDLRREVLAPGGSLRHPYFRDLNRQLRTPTTTCTEEDLVEACAASRVVYVGDFHSDPACQVFVADLLERLSPRVSGLALGVEFLFTRQQRLLDRRQDGRLDDATFLRRVHYREEWGYPWEGFRAMLDRARRLGVPVHALDVPPRGGFDGLTRRDEHAARRIVSIVTASPDGCLVVLFGESHVSRGHIPKRAHAHFGRAGMACRQLTVFQDPDSAYWSFLSQGQPAPGTARMGEDTFAVFHTSPLAKYESYRQVLERWRGDVPPEEEVDLTPAVHHLIRVLLGWLGIRPERYRIRHSGGWAEELSDAFPEVYSGPEAEELLEPILEEHRRSESEVDEARALLAERGALYEPRSNTLFLARYLPGRAAGEGARFLRAALTGRLFLGPEDQSADVTVRVYGAAYNEALAYLGGRLVDPTSDLLAAGTTGPVDPGPRLSRREGAMRVAWMEAHRAFESTRRLRPPGELLEPLRASRSLRRVLGRDLGHRLGRQLFEQVRNGTLDRGGLRTLFSRKLDPPRGHQVFLRLLRRR